VKLFLDSSAVLAACGRSTGASRCIFDAAESHGWELQTSSFSLSEVNANVGLLPPPAAEQWHRLQPQLMSVPDVISFPWITVFASAKDRPILLTAAAWSDVLLTLDRRDFFGLLGGHFYGLPIMTPGDFLRRERSAGRW
jgi:hypothetical protein